MVAMQPDRGGINPDAVVTVFGGTGFLGRRIVNRLLAKGFTVRAASRHPERAGRDATTGGRAAEAI
jgi:uncharacterized protein YbjT (DUF2867 family)